ncbi:hypothetical protein HXX76_006205 [Chlamydomonas incerta]|uniref:CTLH domain-containing protein n=1 Tax=Chlamydomonas incerta TaxID=51695 RepID=A0A835W132_CHLIN|nr:hypothetical protein HXX76_006205 [Chlamydomonas incerta]|eukprot:KAG2436677.1 hypothetical protein HXX76_006205 [Chlamydomonas incerta]
MRAVCPAALETDVRLVFRARKQKFVELLRRGGGAEAALACARSELAPLALDAYPEAYSEFKRLLLLLLLPPAAPPAQQQQQPQPFGGSSSKAAGAGDSGAAAAARDAAPQHPQPQQPQQPQQPPAEELAALLDPAATADFADTAYFTVRALLGLQQPLLGLQLRFLLRLHAAHPPPPATPSAPLAAELAPRLLMTQPQSQLPQQSLSRHPGGGPAARAGAGKDPAPLPRCGGGPGGGGGGGGPLTFPEADVQAVIHGAGTSRQEALEALRHAGGDALSAFRAELGRLRLAEPLLAELAAEYAAVRGLLLPPPPAVAPPPAHAGSSKAAAGPANAEADIRVGGEGEAEDGGAAAVGQRAGASPAAALAALGALAASGRQPQGSAAGEEEGGGGAAAAVGSGAGGGGGSSGGGRAGPGPLTLARADAAVDASPPTKVARRSPPSASQSPPGSSSPEVAEGGEGGERGEGGEEGSGADGERRGSGAGASVSGRGGGSGGGGGGSGGLLKGQALLAELQRLGQAGDVDGVQAAAAAADPGLWAAHPPLLFDLRRCAYGQLLAAGRPAEALELARRELTPMTTEHPALLPLLKNAMAALLPPLPPPPPPPQPQQQTGSDGDGASPSLPPPPPLLTLAAALEQQQQLPPPPPLRFGSGAADTACGAGGGGWGGGAGAGGGAGRGGLLPTLPGVVCAITAALQPRLGLTAPRLVRLLEALLVSHRTWLRAEKLSADPFAGPMRLNALRAMPPPPPLPPPPPPLPHQGPGAGGAGVAGGGGGGAAGAGGQPDVSATAMAAAMAAAAAAAAGGHSAGLEAAARLLSRTFRQVVPPAWLEAGGPHYGLFAGGIDAGAGGAAGAAAAAAGVPDPMLLMPGGGGGGAGAGDGGGGDMGGGAAAAGDEMEYDDEMLDDEELQVGLGGFGGGMAGGMAGGGGGGVDEESVLQLMEILELPRGAAIDLLAQHEGDVQAAILSITS